MNTFFRRFAASVISVILMIGMSVSIAHATGLSAASTDEPQILGQGACGDNLTWVYKDDASLTISGTGAMYDFEETTQPWNEWMTLVETVTIEEGVTTIGDYAFYNASLLFTCSLPNTLISIGDHAFSGNGSTWTNKLESVSIPEGVTIIGPYAFAYCSSLKRCELHEGVETIGDYCFYECSNLDAIEMPDTVTTVGSNAYVRCKNAQRVVLSNSLVSVGEDAFLQCNSNEDVVIPGSMQNVGKKSFRANYFKAGIILSEGVKTIESYAFDGCEAVRMELPTSTVAVDSPVAISSWAVQEYIVEDGNPVFFSYNGALFKRDDSADTFSLYKWPCASQHSTCVLPEGTVSIYTDATYGGCDSIEKIVVPSTITDYRNFGNLLTLAPATEIEVSPDNAVFSAVNGALFSKDEKRMMRCPKGHRGYYSIPSAATSINEGAFTGCSYLVGVTIPEGITAIPSKCFAQCSRLRDCYIPSSVSSIAYDSFERGSWGAYPDSPNYKFFFQGTESEWENLLGDSDYQLVREANVYLNVANYIPCVDGLTTLLSSDGVLTVIDSPDLRLIYNPEYKIESYAENEAPWKGIQGDVTSIVIEGLIASIGDRAFSDLPNVQDVQLGSNVSEVGAAAFSECDRLEIVKCLGAPFSVQGAMSDSPSFDSQKITIRYNLFETSWNQDSNFDAESNTWNGYRIESYENETPALARVELGQSEIEVDGCYDDGCYRISFVAYSETGEDISSSVSLSFDGPTSSQEYLDSFNYGFRDVSAYRAWSGSAFRVSRTDRPLRNVGRDGIYVGGGVPAGDYTVTFVPINGKAKGNPISKTFTVTRTPERLGAQNSSYQEGSAYTPITSTVKGYLDSADSVRSVAVYNQFGENSVSRCNISVVDSDSGDDVTNLAASFGFTVNETGDHYCKFCINRFAVPRNYSVLFTPKADSGITRPYRYPVNVYRDQDIINVPYSISLTDGDSEIAVGANGTWSSSPYRTRVIDAYNDPCWPEITWTVTDANGADVTSSFEFDEQDYVFVKSEARSILNQDGSGTEFTVTASTSNGKSASLPLTLKLEPEYVAPVTHTAIFKIGDQVIGAVEFAEGDSSLEEPAMPQKDNYVGAWEPYDLAAATDDIVIEGRYTPVNPETVSDVSEEATAEHENGAVTVNLAAVATSKFVKVESSKTKPVDVVLVLDQSGSMAETLGASGQSKRDALVECANEFTQQLYQNAIKTGTDHRIAVVGFAYSAYNNGGYRNTGLLATTNGGAKAYPQLTSSDYASALLPISKNGEINSNVVAGINSIAAEGATSADVGLKIAQNIFSENPVGLDADGAADRERVVIFITDGTPTWWGLESRLVTQTGSEAITVANTIKQGQGANIYSVGVDPAADPAAPFTASESGVTLDRRGNFASYDLNRFLHAVSSNYPEATAMNDMGSGSQDAGFCMAVNDTSNLGKMFTNILYNTVYSIESFDKATLTYTLPAGFVLTMQQEEEMRAALAARGLTDDDILVSTVAGVTSISISNVPVVAELGEDGVERYVARVSFKISADKDVSGDVSAGATGSALVNGDKVADFEMPTVNIPSDRCLLVFKVNDAIYEIREASMGDEIASPSTGLAKWVELEKLQQAGEAVVGSSYAVFETSTLTRKYDVTWTVGGWSLVKSYDPGVSVSVPDEVLTHIPDGYELAGWSPMTPATMPARNISCTAVVTPVHVHDYSAATYQTGSCDTGIVTHHVCACGAERTEAAAPDVHSYTAALSDNGRYGTTIEKLVCDKCGHTVEKNITYNVYADSGWNWVRLDLNKYQNEVLQSGASDDDITMRFYVGDRWGGNMLVYRVDEDGETTSYEARVVDGYLEFDPNHFSVYMIGGDDEKGTVDAGSLSYDFCEELKAASTLPEVSGEPEGLVVASADDLSLAEVSGLVEKTYTGSAIEQDIVVKYGSDTLTKGTDYAVTYTNNTNAGTATMTVSGMGMYSGTKKLTFTISPAPIKGVELSKLEYGSDGNTKRPNVTVTWSGGTVPQDGYDVTWVGDTFTPGTKEVKVTGKGNFTGEMVAVYVVPSSQQASDEDEPPVELASQPMHRLYNPNSGEHFYTASDAERDHLVSLGWSSEGEGWTAPATSATPVHRLYNANGGEHHYTMSEAEKDFLVSAGWSYEGVGWYSDDAQGVPLFREYNPNAFSNNHNYTTSAAEHEWLLSLGWRDEGRAWYGI